jgi:hypothetical protein
MERPPQEPGSQGWLPPQAPGTEPAAPPPAPSPPSDPPPSPPSEPPPSPPSGRTETDPSHPSPASPQQPQSPPPPPPPPAYAPPAAGYAQPQYGYGPQQHQPYGYAYGYGQPAYYAQPHQYGGWQQQQWAPPGQWPQQPAYAHPSYGPEPDNDPAIASLTLALSGLGLLLFSAGFSAAIVSPAAGGFAIYYGRKGMQKVDKGETRRYRGAAKAGFILGIVTVVLSIAAAALWIIVIATNPDVFDESEAVIRAALSA